MKPSLEQWTELDEVSKTIKKIDLWEYLWDSNLITIILPGREEPLYCSTMGRGGEWFTSDMPVWKAILNLLQLYRKYFL